MADLDLVLFMGYFVNSILDLCMIPFREVSNELILFPFGFLCVSAVFSILVKIIKSV